MNQPLAKADFPHPEQPSTTSFRQRVQGSIQDIEMETARLLRLKPRGLNMDTPLISLLRVAHYALSALLELMEMDRESRP